MIGRFHTISEWQPSPFRKVWSSWRTGRPQLMASLARQQERFGIPFGTVGRGSCHRKLLRPEVWRRSRAISPWPPPDGECTSGLFNSHGSVFHWSMFQPVLFTTVKLLKERFSKNWLCDWWLCLVPCLMELSITGLAEGGSLRSLQVGCII